MKMILLLDDKVNDNQPYGAENGSKSKGGGDEYAHVVAKFSETGAWSVSAVRNNRFSIDIGRKLVT